MTDLARHMEAVASHLLGTPNAALSKPKKLRFGTNGSLSIDLDKGTWYDHEQETGSGVLGLIKRETGLANGEAVEWLKDELGILLGSDARQIVAEYPYTDERGNVLFEVCRFEPKDFRQRRPNGSGGWIWNLNGISRVPFHLPQLLAAVGRKTFIVEGEKDVLALERSGQIATCNPEGAGKWRPEFNGYFAGRDVIIIPDKDEVGEKHALDIARNLVCVAKSVRILHLPGLLSPKEDVSDWIGRGGTHEELLALCEDVPLWKPDAKDAPQDRESQALGVDQFHAYMPMHQYLFEPSRELWPSSSVNSRLASITVDGKAVRASDWLDKNRAVDQMTWAPGEPMLIRDRLVSNGGWIVQPNCVCFNQYRPPSVTGGESKKAERWVSHIRTLYGDDADHIVKWLAQRVQQPGEKINHAIVLGGAQGIGKDTILEPVKHAVGPWNFTDVSPAHLLGRFNGFVKSVILRVSEARDLGDVDRYAFYEHLKIYTASPPDVIRVDEKNLKEYAVMNVCGVVLTSNHKTDGIYLPADDRRHFVAWSEKTRTEFNDGYWSAFYRWLADGGNAHVAAYLAGYDLRGFDPKAPPPKTAAFWDIVDSNRAPEDAELADAIDALGNPAAFTLGTLVAAASSDSFREYLGDRRNRRLIPHRLEAVGYVPVRNPDADDGLWKTGGKRKAVYARRQLALRDRLTAAMNLARDR